MAEKRLILVRHGKSDWSGDEDDIGRPLNPRGRRQAPKTGQWINANIEHIDLVVVSPATRATHTWDLIAGELDEPPQVRNDDRLYGASVEDFLEVVREVTGDVETLAVVAHNPGLADLVHELTGERAAMPTSAIAVITWDGSWSSFDRGSAVLRASGRPPELRGA